MDGEGCLQSILEVPELAKRGDRGVYRNERGEEIEVSADRLVSMNMWGLSSELFPDLKREFRAFLESRGRQPRSEFYIPAVIQALIRQGRARVQVLPHSGPWCGITYPEDKQRTAAMLADLVAAGVYPQKLWHEPL